MESSLNNKAQASGDAMERCGLVEREDGMGNKESRGKPERIVKQRAIVSDN